MAEMMPVIPRHKCMFDTRTSICAGVYQFRCRQRRWSDTNDRSRALNMSARAEQIPNI